MEVLAKNLNLINEGLAELLPSFHRKSSEVVSISISKEFVKAVVYIDEVEPGVDFTYSYILPQDAKDFAWIGNVEILKDALARLQSALVNEGYIKEGLKFVITLEDYGFVEQLELPVLEEKELETALSWEIPEHVPWNEGTYIYKYITKKMPDMTTGQDGPSQWVDNLLIMIYAVENVCIENLETLAAANKWGLHMITVAQALQQEDKFVLKSEKIGRLDFYEAHYTKQQQQKLIEEYYVPLLAARQLVNYNSLVNFVSQNQKYKVLLDSYGSIIRMSSVFLLVLAIVAGGSALMVRYWDNHQLVECQKKYLALEVWEQRKAETKILEAKELVLKKQLELLKQEKIQWSKLLKVLGNLMPRGAWLVKLQQGYELNKDKQRISYLTLQGRAQNIEVISELIKNMEGSNEFINAELVSTSVETKERINLGSGNLIHFSIRMQPKQQQPSSKKI